MQASLSPLVSVITPVYNEEEHLAECIASVLAQTYSNWDYTIVNNCSTDGTLAIAQEYAAKDSRIRVITNGALIPAIPNFNSALRQISPASTYCKMVLGDDWMFPECLDRMVSVMEEHPSVGIVGAYGLRNSQVAWVGLPYPSRCISGRVMSRQRFLGGPYVFGSQTSVLFRSDLVRNQDPFFNESNVHADSEACLRLLMTCDFGFVHQILTFSRDNRPNSMLVASRELNTLAAAYLYELVTYGPHCLTAEEYEHSLRCAVSIYYDFLATSVLQGRNRRFWDFHRQKLEEAGIEFRYTSLARGLLRRYRREFRRIRNTVYWGMSAAE